MGSSLPVGARLMYFRVPMSLPRERVGRKHTNNHLAFIKLWQYSCQSRGCKSLVIPGGQIRQCFHSYLESHASY